jgi:hypothetical protein
VHCRTISLRPADNPVSNGRRNSLSGSRAAASAYIASRSGSISPSSATMTSRHGCRASDSRQARSLAVRMKVLTPTVISFVAVIDRYSAGRPDGPVSRRIVLLDVGGVRNQSARATGTRLPTNGTSKSDSQSARAARGDQVRRERPEVAACRSAKLLPPPLRLRAVVVIPGMDSQVAPVATARYGSS